MHKFLILNYDQLWRNCWQMSRYKLCFKNRSGAGKRVRKVAAGMRADKKIHSVRGSRRSITVPCLPYSTVFIFHHLTHAVVGMGTFSGIGSYPANAASPEILPLLKSCSTEWFHSRTICARSSREAFQSLIREAMVVALASVL